MKCKKCDKEIADESLFCSFCGKKQVKQHEKKEYEYKIVTFYHDGRQYKITGKTMREANAKAAKKQYELENALASAGGNMLVEEWALKWFDTYKAPTVGTGQYKNYMSHINSVIIPAIGNKKLKDIKDIDLQEMLNKRAGKSKGDLMKLRMTLKAIFTRACISRMIPYNPSADLILPIAEDKTRRSITLKERENILKVSEVHHAGLWIKIMLYCGLRPGETRALDWRHIDFENKLIYVEQSMKAGTSNIGTTKSAAGIRKIPIPDKLYKNLISLKKELNSPVFMQPTTGKRHTVESMRCLWENFKRALDISLGAKLYRNKIIESKVASDLVAYCMRHTYGTDLQDAGVPLNMIKYFMGHEDISVTAKYYIDITEASIKSSAELINKYH